MKPALRSNSRLKTALGDAGSAYFEHALGSFARLLPHVRPPRWRETAGSEKDTKSVWGKKNQSIEVQIGFSDPHAPTKKERKREQPATPKDKLARKLTTSIRRIAIERASAKQWHTMSLAEHSTCLAIVKQLQSVIRVDRKDANPRSLEVLREAFDDMVVGSLVTSEFGLGFDAGAMLRSIKSLAEQTYENSSLSFGCLISPKARPNGSARFPQDFLAPSGSAACPMGLPPRTRSAATARSRSSSRSGSAGTTRISRGTTSTRCGQRTWRPAREVDGAASRSPDTETS